MTVPRTYVDCSYRVAYRNWGSAEATGGRIYVLSLSPVFTLLVCAALGGYVVAVCGRRAVFVERLAGGRLLDDH